MMPAPSAAARPSSCRIRRHLQPNTASPPSTSASSSRQLLLRAALRRPSPLRAKRLYRRDCLATGASAAISPRRPARLSPRSCSGIGPQHRRRRRFRLSRRSDLRSQSARRASAQPLRLFQHRLLRRAAGAASSATPGATPSKARARSPGICSRQMIPFGNDHNRRVDMRWEITNLTNTPQFHRALDLVGSSTFGRVIGAAAMRTMDIMTRINF